MLVGRIMSDHDMGHSKIVKIKIPKRELKFMIVGVSEESIPLQARMSPKMAMKR